MMISRRLIVVYLALVGAPFLLLLAVLQRGQSLEASSALEGLWRVRLSGPVFAASSCGPVLGLFQEADMRISQSGVYLQAGTTNQRPVTFRGRIDGSSFWLESVQRDNSLLNRGILRLTGAVTFGLDQPVIRGTLLMPRVFDCPPQSVDAVMLAEAGDLASDRER